MNIEKGLIVDEPWIGHLLAGRKVWEMRSRNTMYRGWLGLIRKGSGTVVGIGRLVDVGEPLSLDEMITTFDKHCIPEEKIRSGKVAKWNIPWKLAGIRALARPVPYVHKPGAVTWVVLEHTAQEAIAAQLGDSEKPVSRFRLEKPMLSSRYFAPKESDFTRLTSTMSTCRNGRVIGQASLTEANITHGHIYLRSFFDRFPSDAVGGSSKANQAMRSLTVETSTGDRFETDLDGAKKFFRARGPIRAFFETSKARAGDVVLVEQLAPYHYRISILR